MDCHWAKDILRKRIHSAHPQDLSQKFKDYACVALLIKGSAENPYLGFIVRASNPSDRWSGQIAFPGGRREPSDSSDVETAIRETFEEIGLRLTKDNLLGKLNDVQARKAGQMLEFYIRPFVFYVEQDYPLNLSQTEVAEFFWHPISDLIASDQSRHHMISFDGMSAKLPAIDLKKSAKLWGLSYLMTLDLLKTIA